MGVPLCNIQSDTPLSSKFSKILVIQGVVFSKNVDIIIDTGAFENITSAKFVKEFQILPLGTRHLVTADDHRIQIKGQKTLQITFQNNTAITVDTLVIENLPKPLLLGVKFLLQYGAIINFSDKILQFPHLPLTIPFHTNYSQDLLGIYNDDYEINQLDQI